MNSTPSPTLLLPQQKKKKNQRTVTKPNRTENQTERNETDENKNYKRWREQS